jgi:hypothetical protein
MIFHRYVSHNQRVVCISIRLHPGFVAAPLNSQMLPKTNWAEDGSSTKC